MCSGSLRKAVQIGGEKKESKRAVETGGAKHGIYLPHVIQQTHPKRGGKKRIRVRGKYNS